MAVAELAHHHQRQDKKGDAHVYKRALSGYTDSDEGHCQGQEGSKTIAHRLGHLFWAVVFWSAVESRTARL